MEVEGKRKERNRWWSGKEKAPEDSKHKKA